MNKRILVVSQYYYPEQFRINDICSELVCRGYDVTVLTGIPNYPEGRFFEGYGRHKNLTEEHEGVKIIRVPIIPRGHNPVKLLMNYFSFMNAGKRWVRHTDLEFDSVFIFEVSPMMQAEVGTLYGKRNSVPVTIYVQDLWPENVQVVAGLKNKAIIKYIDRKVDKIYEGCTRILATSPSFKARLDKRDSTKDKEGQSKVTYWPQYAEEFYRPDTDEATPEDFPKDERFKLTFTGNVGYAQGLDVLPKLFSELKSKGRECDFVIIGDGRYMDTQKKETEEAGAEEYFYFLGRKPAKEIPGYLKASDAAFVSFTDNSLWNMTIPAKLQSYMACGKPILAAAGGETGHIIEEAGCGFCSSVGDVSKLADNLIKLMESDLSALGRNAYEYTNSHFNKKELMDELETYI